MGYWIPLCLSQIPLVVVYNTGRAIYEDIFRSTVKPAGI